MKKDVVRRIYNGGPLSSVKTHPIVVLKNIVDRSPQQRSISFSNRWGRVETQLQQAYAFNDPVDGLLGSLPAVPLRDRMYVPAG